VRRLLDLAGAEVGCGTAPAGLIRVSFGLANDHSDIDRLVAGLTALSSGTYRGAYRLCEDGCYRPEGWSAAAEDYFTLHESLPLR
jgi:hypothetical protein